MQDRLSGPRSSQKVLPQRKKRVLVVDEDLNDLLYYSAVLQHEGYDVRSLASYQKGVASFDHEAFDLVIVSQGTAAFEGRTVLVRALDQNQGLPVFVLSRSSDIDCYLEAMQMGAFDYREKPLAASELAEMVGRHLQVPKSRAA